ncbi:MAG: PHP domain-containing protein [Oscillospiraceae bacterium]
MDTIYWGPEQTPRWDFDWDAVRRQFRQAQEQWGHRITLRLGAELGEAYLGFQRAEILMHDAQQLDFVIGSVHMAGKKFHHKDLYYPGKADEAYYDSIIDSYLEDVLALARWGQFQVLGHLTLPLRYMNENYGEHMTFAHHMDQVEEIFSVPSSPRGSALSAIPTGETGPCRAPISCGSTAIWAARSSPWAATLTRQRMWAA